MRGLPLNLEPKFFPADPTLADRCVIALTEQGADPEGFLGRVHKAVWADEKNIAAADTLAALLVDEGHDAGAAVAAAQGAPVADIHDRNTKEAVAADAVGAPTYVLNGEPFWGQDRLDHLDHALKTGRGPYKG